MLLLEKVVSVSMAMSYCLGDRGPGLVLLNHWDLWTSEHSKDFPPLLSNNFLIIITSEFIHIYKLPWVVVLEAEKHKLLQSSILCSRLPLCKPNPELTFLPVKATPGPVLATREQC